MFTKGKSPKQSLTRAKNLTIMLLEVRDSPGPAIGDIAVHRNTRDKLE